MKTSIYVFIGLMIGWLSIGCQVQQMENYNEDFRGEWASSIHFSPSVGDSIQNYLTVDGNNSGLGIACKVDCPFCDCLITQSGRAKINTSTMTIQVGGTVSQILTVEEEPFINTNGVWEMTLEGQRYFKN